MFGIQKIGIRIASLALVLFCLFCQTGFAFAQQETAQTTLTSIVRNRAAYNGANIGRLENGTAVTVLGQRGSFYKIDCYDMVGYIAKSQVVHNEAEDKYYVNCAENSSETVEMTYVEQEEVLYLRHQILELAKKQLGTPYVYGGTRPGGFDCSGLMYYLYGEHGFALHRTASQQLQDGIIVAKEGMQVGDLVFFREYYETYPASHVGIYAGNNQIIHAGSEGISYADLDGAYFSDYFLCARRIVNTAAVALEINETHSRRITSFGITKSISGRNVR